MGEGQLAEDVGRLKEGLGELPEPVVRPCLVMVSGLPGTGKSYFCQRLAERVGLVVLESDALRKLLFPRPIYSVEESYRLFRACYRVVEELLAKGVTVALDATNLEERHREQLYHIADRVGARLVIVRTEAPPEVVRQRLDRRSLEVERADSSEADWDVYRKMEPTVEKIRRHHLVVDTTR
ncbi:MAG: hypothetical protein DRI39_02460, partial [Chloroflexi bacterium]